jgi:peptidoglycan/LPS O-acetylase OafA/YrhL
MLPTRVWELLLGGVLASYRIPLRKEAASSVLPNPVLEEAIGWAGLALIFAGFFTIDEAGGFPGAIALIPTIGTLLVLISVGGARTASARFSRRPSW